MLAYIIKSGIPQSTLCEKFFPTGSSPKPAVLEWSSVILDSIGQCNKIEIKHN